MKHALFLTALAVPAALFAQAQSVALNSKAFVVKQVPDGPGKTKNTLVVPERVLPGEALVFMLEYKNTGAKPATAFVINNPIPENVIYTGAEQPWAEVSVDRGKTFGQLAALKVAKGDGTMRAALPNDVTAVRWKFTQPIPAAGEGRVMFFAMVK
ncbi:MAG: hypothetical protein AABY88_06140 [Pseudomonadota bacterium]